MNVFVMPKCLLILDNFGMEECFLTKLIQRMELYYVFMLSIKETQTKLKCGSKSLNLELNKKNNLLTIDHFIRGQTSGGLKNCTIGPHSFKKPCGPMMLMKCNSLGKNIFQLLIGNFDLSICLRVVG